MNRIGIMGAMQLEIDLIKEEMNIQKEYEIAGFLFYVGTLHNKEIILTRCGVGKVNAAACTQMLIGRFNVNSIINTGIAGSLRDDIKIGDVVISTDTTHHDVRKAQMKNLFPFQETFVADEMLIDLSLKVCNSLELRSHSGRIVSGECFVAESDLKAALINEYSPACVEMEGSAIGHVAHINNIPFLILRCISDNADEEAEISYKNFESFAGNQSASIVIEMVKGF